MQAYREHHLVRGEAEEDYEDSLRHPPQEPHHRRREYHRRPRGNEEETEKYESECYICGWRPSCKNGSNKTSLLARHHNAQHEERGWQCDQRECNYKAMWQRRDLDLHKARKHAAPRFFCDQCDFKTSTEVQLRRHVKNIHIGPSKEDRRKFPCDQCGRHFSSAGSRTQHVRMIHERLFRPRETPDVYQCDQCAKGFSRRSNRSQHVKRMHAGIKMKEEKKQCAICAKVMSNINSLRAHTRRCHDGGVRLRYFYTDFAGVIHPVF